MRFIPLFLSVFLVCVLPQRLLAQVKVQGVVLSKGGVLPGATIRLLTVDSTFISGTLSGDDGTFTLNVFPSKKYLLKVELLSYKTRYKNIDVAETDMDALRMFLQEETQELKEVEIKGTQVRGEQKGDTTHFNAGAYKTNPDATAEDLVKKMPGVTTDNSGVKVNGEAVQKVLVDGKPFFGDDPNAALKNVPADMIDRVEVFDKMSDQSQFTGFNDGSQQKTLNLVTKKGRNVGQFGRVYGGAGADAVPELRYQSGAALNAFNEKRRVTLLLMANNINQQNFSNADISGAMGNSGGGGRNGGGMMGLFSSPQNGNTTTRAGGLNYSDSWGKKITVSGSYFYNSSANRNVARLSRNYFTDNQLVYKQNNDNTSNNENHRLNLRLEYAIDSLNKLIFTPAITLQNNESGSDLSGSNSIFDNIFLSRTSTSSKNKVKAYDFSNNILFQHKFKKSGRTFSTNLYTTLNERNIQGSYLSNNVFSDTIFTGLDQVYTTYSYTKRYQFNLSYTEPLSKVSQLQINYNPSLTKSKSDKSTEDFNLIRNEYSDFNSNLSNKYLNDYQTQKAGLTYRYNKNKLNFSIGLDAQQSSLKGDQTFPVASQLSQDFKNLLPNAQLNYRMSQGKNLRVYYRSSTNIPSLNQLQNVIDLSNPLQISSGNPLLKQTFDHNVNIRYGGFNNKTSRNAMVFLNASSIGNYIANATYILRSDTVLLGNPIKAGTQLSKPVNLNGYYNSRVNGVLGFPLKKLKSNINFNAGFNYTRNPSLINYQLNYSNSYNTSGGLFIGSNISQNLDFSLGYNGGYTSVINTVQKQSNNSYYTQTLMFKINVIVKSRLVINTDISNTQYTGLSQSFNQNYYIWNAYLGYKFLKNKSLEAKVSVFDILNQNRSISRTVNSSYTEDNYSNVLQRYGLFTLTYTFKHFKGNSAPPKTEEGPPPYPGGPPGMRPPREH